MTPDQLYDSEATLRLVDRVLDDLDMSDPFRHSGGRVSGYRTEQLRGDGPADAGDASDHFLRAFWEIHDALELLRDSHAALRPSADALASGDEQQRLDRALALVDRMCGEEADAAAHEALRTELLALAEHLGSREVVSDRLQHTAGLLLDLEGRLAHLARVFVSEGGPTM